MKFDVEVVIKDEAFTRKGRLRKAFRFPVAKLLQFEAHRFIEQVVPDDLIKNTKITLEDVEVIDEPPEAEEQTS